MNGHSDFLARYLALIGAGVMNKMTSINQWQWAFFRLAATAARLLGGRVLPVLLVIGLCGCSRTEAPSFSLLGSYFPSWLACAFIGIIAAVIARILFIRIGIDDLLPWRLLVYVCLALAVAFTSSLLLFAR